ncbi:MAG: hypothetical protein AAB562_02885 [Patescibacteria group bacterium]
MRWKFSLALSVVVLTVAFLLTGCAPDAPRATPPPTPSITILEEIDIEAGYNIYVLHDQKRSVTCYAKGAGISCIPDSVLAKPSPESAPTK